MCTEKVDLWSAGVSLFAMVTACFPYTITVGDPPLQSITAGIAALDRHPSLGAVSGMCKDLILKLLEIDQCSRISADEAMEHPWFAGIVKDPKGLQSKITFPGHTVASAT
jgi:calcium-dependent protein kinase